MATPNPSKGRGKAIFVSIFVCLLLFTLFWRRILKNYKIAYACFNSKYNWLHGL